MTEQIDETSLPPRRRRKLDKEPPKVTKREIVDEMELGSNFAGGSILFGIPSFTGAAIVIKWNMFMAEEAPAGSQGSILAFYDQSIVRMVFILTGVALLGFVGSILIGRGTHKIRLLARCTDGSISRVDRSFLFKKLLSEKLRKERFESITVQFSGNIYVVSLRDHRGNDDPLLTTKDDSAYRAFVKKLEKLTQLRVVR